MQFIEEVCRSAKLSLAKVVVVSYFTETLDFVAEMLERLEVAYALLDGRSAGKERQRIVEDFKTNKTVLLLSGKAGGTGLTLTCATTMVMIEPDWNPSNDSQVMGRIWRQSQEQPVRIFRLIIVSSF